VLIATDHYTCVECALMLKLLCDVLLDGLVNALGVHNNPNP